MLFLTSSLVLRLEPLYHNLILIGYWGRFLFALPIVVIFLSICLSIIEED